MKEGHIPIPRYRSFTGPALLKQGFRPYFLAAGLWAPLALVLFLMMLMGFVSLPTAFDPVSWHYHEMLFGFVAAAIAGFVLTTIPNWTGRLPLQGIPLLCLALLWVAGRVAVATSALIGAGPAALIDLAFLAALVTLTLREVVAGRNWRNLPVIGILILFLLCNAVSHAEVMGLMDSRGLAPRISIAVVVTLISLMGGRIIPSFTRNWLVRRKFKHVPGSYGRFDLLTIAATPVALGFWAILPEGRVSALLAAFAAALHLWRLRRWHGYATYPEPMLWILHISYLWIPVGFALLALSHWWPGVSQIGALHAFTAGAMGGMILAVISRSTMSHTGRMVKASRGLLLAFVFIILSAVLRICSTLTVQHYWPLLLAAAFWVLAFGLYLSVCGPMLLTDSPARKKPQQGLVSAP